MTSDVKEDVGSENGFTKEEKEILEEKKLELKSSLSFKHDKTPIETKSSTEILTELFSAFNAEPPVIEDVCGDGEKTIRTTERNTVSRRSSESGEDDSAGDKVKEKKGEKKKKEKKKKHKHKSSKHKHSSKKESDSSGINRLHRSREKDKDDIATYSKIKEKILKASASKSKSSSEQLPAHCKLDSSKQYYSKSEVAGISCDNFQNSVPESITEASDSSYSIYDQSRNCLHESSRQTDSTGTETLEGKDNLDTTGIIVSVTSNDDVVSAMEVGVIPLPEDCAHQEVSSSSMVKQNDNLKSNMKEEANDGCEVMQVSSQIRIDEPSVKSDRIVKRDGKTSQSKDVDSILCDKIEAVNILVQEKCDASSTQLIVKTETPASSDVTGFEKIDSASGERMEQSASEKAETGKSVKSSISISDSKAKSKIKIKNLKFSTVFQQTLKEAEEQARKKEEEEQVKHNTESENVTIPPDCCESKPKANETQNGDASDQDYANDHSIANEFKSAENTSSSSVHDAKELKSDKEKENVSERMGEEASWSTNLENGDKHCSKKEQDTSEEDDDEPGRDKADKIDEAMCRKGSENRSTSKSKAKEKKKRHRSRSKSREKSKKQKRSKSPGKAKSRSRSRSVSKSKKRKRSRSRSESKSKRKKRSRSRSKGGKSSGSKAGKKSRSKHRKKSRSKSKERKKSRSRSVCKDTKERRSLSKDKESVSKEKEIKNGKSDSKKNKSERKERKSESKERESESKSRKSESKERKSARKERKSRSKSKGRNRSYSKDNEITESIDEKRDESVGKEKSRSLSKEPKRSSSKEKKRSISKERRNRSKEGKSSSSRKQSKRRSRSSSRKSRSCSRRKSRSKSQKRSDSWKKSRSESRRRSESRKRSRSRKKSRSVSRSRSKKRSSSRGRKRSHSRSGRKSRSESRKESSSRSRRRSGSRSCRKSRSQSRQSRSRSRRKSRSRSRRSSSRRSRSRKRSQSPTKSRRSRSDRESRERSKRSSSRKRSRSRRKSRSCSKKRSRSHSKVRSKSDERRSSSNSQKRSRGSTNDKEKDSRRSKTVEKSKLAAAGGCESTGPSSITSGDGGKSGEGEEEKLDKARLLEIARKNAVNLLQQGSLPPSVVGKDQKGKLLTLKAGGKSVEELTEYCKELSRKEAMGESSDSDGEGGSGCGSHVAPVIHHPFQIKERPTPGMIGIGIRSSLPPANAIMDKPSDQSKLRMQFPVSSGQEHRKTESDSPLAICYHEEADIVEDADSVSGDVPEEKEKIIIDPKDQVFPDYSNCELNMDIGSIVSQRLTALRKLQENPDDLDALNEMTQAQKDMQVWAESKSQPGLFTGSTGAKVLSAAELASGSQAWARKDQLKCATPLTGGMGMLLLQKMGWRPGEGLGKNKEGVLEPLKLDVKTDKRGLVSQEELHRHTNVHRRGHVARSHPRHSFGKHPVSVLVEICSKRRWKVPHFQLVFESGPDHKKSFLFKAIVNGVEYQPPAPSPNKKQAKAHAASICLQAIGVYPPTVNYEGACI